MKQAAFIFNRIAHDGATKTPYGICMGSMPSLNMVRFFGFHAYFHNINYPKQFVARAKSMVHVGISDVCHGWVLWDPVLNKLKCGASVVFDESVLPQTASDSNVLDAAISSLRLTQLGDFSHIRDLEIQDACLNLVSALSPFMSDAPNTYHQDAKSADRTHWMDTCQAEIGMMIQLHVWDEVPQSANTEILTCCWVFSLKRNQEGTIVKFKGRIVAQVFKKIHGINVGETLAPTPTFSSLQLLLAMASCFKWPVASFVRHCPGGWVRG
jgi:hypothetical protein